MNGFMKTGFIGTLSGGVLVIIGGVFHASSTILIVGVFLAFIGCVAVMIGELRG